LSSKSIPVRPFARVGVQYIHRPPDDQIGAAFVMSNALFAKESGPLSADRFPSNARILGVCSAQLRR
jgi:hypothetical protein